MNKTPLRITPQPLFHTPDSNQEITDWINKHPPQDRIAMFTAAGMTWNFLAKLVEAHNEFGGDSVSDGSQHVDPKDILEYSKPYHTLLTRMGEDEWEAEFGDYDYATVLSEVDDVGPDATWLIITTKEDQPSINDEINRLNAFLRSQKVKEEAPASFSTCVHGIDTDERTCQICEEGNL